MRGTRRTLLTLGVTVAVVVGFLPVAGAIPSEDRLPIRDAPDRLDRVEGVQVDLPDEVTRILPIDPGPVFELPDDAREPPAVAGPVEQPVGEGCGAHLPHPPIRVTEDAGQQGFVLVEGTPTYRPGSGVIAGLGTEDHPYLIAGWCIDGGQDVWDRTGLAPDQDHGILLKDTDAHVVVRNVVVRNHTGHGIRLDGSANVTVANSTVVVNDQAGISAERIRSSAFRGNNLTRNRHGARLSVALGTAVASNLVANNSRSGVRLSGVRDTTIRDNTVAGQRSGIKLLFSFDNTVEANDVENNSNNGVALVASGSNRIRGNTLTGNARHGMALTAFSLFGGGGNTIVDNTVADNGRNGLRLFDVSNNEIVDNRISGNGAHGVLLGGSFLGGSQSNGIRNNTVTDSGGDGVKVSGFGSSSNAIRDNRLSRNRFGVNLRLATSSRVEDNLVDDNRRAGIVLRSTPHGEVRDNTVEDNGDHGIRLTDVAGLGFGSARTTVEGNLVEDNRGDGLVVDASSHNTTVRNNTIAGHRHGISMTSDDNVVEANWVLVNGEGIVISGSTNVTVARNNIHDNVDAGLRVVDTADPVDARRNWWGHGSGPSGGVQDACTGRIAGGFGDEIQTFDARVCFDPWLTSSNPDAGAP